MLFYKNVEKINIEKNEEKKENHHAKRLSPLLGKKELSTLS